MAKKKQKQEQGNIIKPDFSALIEQMKQEKQQQQKEQAGKKQAQRPKPEQEQQLETITVTPDDIEPPRKHEGSEQERERQQRLKRARELVREEKQEREQGQDTGSEAGEGEVLEGIDYPRGGPQTTPDVERQIEILQQAIEQGESIPVIAKRYGVSRRAIQHYIARAKEEIELNSQLLDIKLVESLDSKIKEIVLAVDKSKLATATVRDLAIAAGIFLDKRKELLGPRAGTGNLRLRATFRGEGAIEVTAGEQ